MKTIPNVSVYGQKFSGYIRIKVLDVNKAKILFLRVFFSFTSKTIYDRNSSSFCTLNTFGLILFYNLCKNRKSPHCNVGTTHKLKKYGWLLHRPIPSFIFLRHRNLRSLKVSRLSLVITQTLIGG